MSNLIKETKVNQIIVKSVFVVILAAAMIPHLYKLTIPIPTMNCTDTFSDDSFYYYKTAINIRKGFGSTFDTINFTNGYHPLWMLICVGLTFITTDIHAYFYIALVANLSIVLLLSLQLFRMFKESLGIYFAVFLILLLNWHRNSSGAIFSGLETPLYLLLLLSSVEMMTKMSWRKKKSLIALGILFGLTFLARTSFVLFAPVFVCYIVYRFVKEKDINLFNATACISVPVLFITVPYLMWNFIMTGHFEQISGLTKNLWDCGAFRTVQHFKDATVRFSQMMPVILWPRILTIIPFILICLCILVVIKKRSSRDFLKDHRVILLATFSMVSAGYYFFKYGRAVRLWHLAPALVGFDVLFVHALKTLYDWVSKKKVIRAIALLVMVVILANCFYQETIYRHKLRSKPSIRDTMTTWIRNNLPKDATIGVWNAGYIGYFSERKVINLDGLINGKELYDYYKSGKGVWNYIIDKRIDYIADYYYQDPPLPKRNKLKDRLKEVYRLNKTPISDKEKPASYYVWQIEYDD